MNAQGGTKFTVSVTDTCTGQKVQVEVSEAVHQVLTVETRRRFWREESRDRRHIDNFNGLHQYIEIDHPNTAGETLETIFTRRETTRQIFEIVNACTPTQRRRFFRYIVLGYNYREISEMEHVNNKAIMESVNAVLKKLRRHRDEILSD